MVPLRLRTESAFWPSQHAFACRHCCGLRYGCQSESKSDRAAPKLRKIQQRDPPDGQTLCFERLRQRLDSGAIFGCIREKDVRHRVALRAFGNDRCAETDRSSHLPLFSRTNQSPRRTQSSCGAFPAGSRPKVIEEVRELVGTREIAPRRVGMLTVPTTSHARISMANPTSQIEGPWEGSMVPQRIRFAIQSATKHPTRRRASRLATDSPESPDRGFLRRSAPRVPCESHDRET